MTNPLSHLLDGKTGNGFMPRARRVLTGLVHDFWKDGTENPFAKVHQKTAAVPDDKIVPPLRFPSAMPADSSAPALWHALPGEISEKMWGEGFVAPGSKAVTDMLIKPMGLDNKMSVLDLSAGLGGRMRAATEETGAYITGLEPDAGIAERGMKMSIVAGKGKHDMIAHYEPENFAAGKTVARNYDCIIARETFYRVRDKTKFFEALAACTKPHAQIGFTDYIVNPEDQDRPAILAWMAYEKNAAPLGLVAMAEAWAKAGFRLRVHDDQTDFYRSEVRAGLQRFAQFLGTGTRPDEETRAAILRRLDTWKYRLAALDQGMKFYRFYGTK